MSYYPLMKNIKETVDKLTFADLIRSYNSNFTQGSTVSGIERPAGWYISGVEGFDTFINEGPAINGIMRIVDKFEQATVDVASKAFPVVAGESYDVGVIYKSHESVSMSFRFYITTITDDIIPLGKVALGVSTTVSPSEDEPYVLPRNDPAANGWVRDAVFEHSSMPLVYTFYGASWTAPVNAKWASIGIRRTGVTDPSEENSLYFSEAYVSQGNVFKHDLGKIMTNMAIAETDSIPANAIYKFPVYDLDENLVGYIPIVTDF